MILLSLVLRIDCHLMCSVTVIFDSKVYYTLSCLCRLGNYLITKFAGYLQKATDVTSVYVKILAVISYQVVFLLLHIDVVLPSKIPCCALPVTEGFNCVCLSML